MRRSLKNLFAAVAMAGACLALPLGAHAHHTKKKVTDPRKKPIQPSASIIIEAETGRVLRARNADLQWPQASLNKVLTVMLAIDAVEAGVVGWHDEVTVTPDITRAVDRQENGDDRFLPEKTMTLREHVNAMTVWSMNESAIAVARHLADSEEKFAELMEWKARAIGARNTRIKNATGYTARGQVSTVRDQALIAQHFIYAYEGYHLLFDQTELVLGDRTVESHNRFLRNFPEGDFSKTGWTRRSKANLVASAVQDGKRVIFVALGAGVNGEYYPATRLAYTAISLINEVGFSRHSVPVEGLEDPVSGEDSDAIQERLSKRAFNPFDRQVFASLNKFPFFLP